MHSVVLSVAFCGSSNNQFNKEGILPKDPSYVRRKASWKMNLQDS